MLYFAKLRWDKDTRAMAGHEALYRQDGHLFEFFDKRSLEWTPDGHLFTTISEDAMVTEVSPELAKTIEDGFRRGLVSV